MKVLASFLTLSFILTLSSVGFAADNGEYIYDDRGRRDPFQPLVSSSGVIINYNKEVRSADLNLEGIMADAGGRSLAIINGEVVQVNGKVGKYVVVKIEKQAVTLANGPEEVVLRLKIDQ